MCAKMTPPPAPPRSGEGGYSYSPQSVGVGSPPSFQEGGRGVGVLPPKLQAGDTIGIIAPSGPFDRDRLAPGLTYLRARGFKVREGRALYQRERYLAGSDRDRAADLNQMMADPEVRAIFVARGGYGSARILDLVDWQLAAAHPKALVGLSDTTALQLGLYTRIGLVTFSGLALCSDVTSEGVHRETESALWRAVCDHRFDPIGELEPLRDGHVEGVLLGGCLSLFTSLVGTSYLPDCTRAVIFLEDVNEPPYRVDRMLTQLRLAGVFGQASGVLFGQFVGCDPERPKEGALRAVLEDFSTQVACPVFLGLPYGHGAARRTMPIGLRARVVGQRLEFLDTENI